MDRYVIQWKCNRWVNEYDENGRTKYRNSVEECREVLKKWKPTRPVRIVKYLGGRKYEEV